MAWTGGLKMMEKTVIKNVKVVLPDKVLENHCVIIEDGKIVDIRPFMNIDNSRSIDSLVSIGDYEVIDGNHNYLSPGFIDIHTHGNSGFDIVDGFLHALDMIAEYNLKNGVTSFLGTVITSSLDDTKRAIKNVKEYINKRKNTNLIGVHLEGPFFNPTKKGAQNEKYIINPDLKVISELLEVSEGSVKMVSIAPELEGALDVIEYLRNEGIRVTLAHTDAKYDQVIRAIDKGITIATHLFNGMSSFNHREPGPVGASLVDDRVYCEIIADGVHLHDATILLTIKVKGYDKVILVSDSMRAAGLNDGEYEFGGQKVYVKDGIARLSSGNLAGSTTDLRKSVYYMVKKLNTSLYEAVKMATINPAKALDINDRKGSIEIGKDADLIIFDDSLNIRLVMLMGRKVENMGLI